MIDFLIEDIHKYAYINRTTNPINPVNPSNSNNPANPINPIFSIGISDEIKL